MHTNIKTITITTTVRDATVSRSTVFAGQKQLMTPYTDLHPDLQMLRIHREGHHSKGAKPNYVPDECFRAEVNYPEGLQKTPSPTH